MKRFDPHPAKFALSVLAALVLLLLAIYLAREHSFIDDCMDGKGRLHGTSGTNTRDFCEDSYRRQR